MNCSVITSSKLGRLPPLCCCPGLAGNRCSPLSTLSVLSHTPPPTPPHLPALLHHPQSTVHSPVQHTHAHHSTAHARTDALFYQPTDYIHHTLTLAPGVNHIRLHDFPEIRRSLVNPSPAASSGLTITLALSNTRGKPRHHHLLCRDSRWPCLSVLDPCPSRTANHYKHHSSLRKQSNVLASNFIDSDVHLLPLGTHPVFKHNFEHFQHNAVVTFPRSCSHSSN
jgi:hypothetical protein